MRLFTAIMLAGALALAGRARAQVPEPLAKIGHIVVIFEENRSFDNLFGLFPGANGLLNAGAAARQTDRTGKPYDALPPVRNTNLRPVGVDTRFPERIANGPFLISPYVPENMATGDLVHRWYQEQMQINGGRMDRFAAISDAGGLTMGYFDASRTAHWKLAGEYALGDAMFHSAFGGSFLNHTFLVCSCAYRWPNAPEKIVAKEDAWGNILKDGQVTPDGYAVNTSRSVYLHAPSDTDPALLVPPQTMPHIGDRLDAKGVSWAWYSGGYADAAAGKPSKLFQFHHQPLAYFQNLAPGTEAQKVHLKDGADLLADIEAGRLPQVVFYKPIGELNLHPGYANITDGDNHLADIVARLQKSPQYQDMLIIVTYDENGGQWDHVAPPRRDKWGPGTRVPLIAVGPTVKRGFIDHTSYDFGSILKTITLRFGAEPVAPPDRDAAPMTNLLQ
ncbi:alkaline phosphatase family protein [Limobrevibacterium gyesilva]|uniref:Acid phosphatase n=1 Tax=Limobrevibacterium gyesilva TaxID=2991712 RepID=A0AA42CG91_9PROT|nr:alkaline phosphatase family protein [Limobrevibacterium gyesilva]MCW3473777.1 acid phosphatase [Limobrevibacterium gyesilva]